MVGHGQLLRILTAFHARFDGGSDLGRQLRNLSRRMPWSVLAGGP